MKTIDAVVMSGNDVKNYNAYKKITQGVINGISWIIYGFIAAGLLYLTAAVMVWLSDYVDFIYNMPDAVFLAVGMIVATSVGGNITKQVTGLIFKTIFKKLNK